MEIEQDTTFEKQQLAAVVLAARDGDRYAFDELFSRYQRAVYLIILRRLGNEAEAQELVQEVFIQALRKIRQLANPLCFGGWLRSIAQRMAINRAMRSRSAVSLDTDRMTPDFAEGQTPLGEIPAECESP